MMDHPGLLFGWRDPTLRDTYNKDEKEYTFEYVTCLAQRLLWVATSNINFRQKFLEECDKAIAISNQKFNELGQA